MSDNLFLIYLEEKKVKNKNKLIQIKCTSIVVISIQSIVQDYAYKHILLFTRFREGNFMYLGTY